MHAQRGSLSGRRVRNMSVIDERKSLAAESDLFDRLPASYRERPGALGALLGGLQLLFHIGEMGMPQTETLARASAVMLLSAFYGLTVKAVVFQPLTARFNRLASQLPR